MKTNEIKVVGAKKDEVIADMIENGWTDNDGNIVLTGDLVGEDISEEQKSRQKQAFFRMYGNVLTDETMEMIEKEYMEIETE